MIIAAQSRGKTILSGEHSVVYGHQALVAGISLMTTIKLDTQPNIKKSYFPTPLLLHSLQLFSRRYPAARGIQIESVDSQIPTGCGLGSSAAVAAALFKALAQAINLKLSDELLIELVQANEQFAHGNPSGVDATAVVKGGLLKFQKIHDRLHHQALANSLSSERLFLINSGHPSETTKQMVALVKERLEANPSLSDTLSAIGRLTATIIDQVQQGTIAWELLQENHRLLDNLGVVGDRARSMIKQLAAEGAVAKITGAGGKQTGSGMILSRHPDPEKIAAVCQKHDWQYYQVYLS